MTGARTSTLATLRGSIEHIEAHGDAYLPDRVALGHADADATLQVGLALGALHDVFGGAGLLRRVAAGASPSTAETRWIVRAAYSPPSAPSLPAASSMPAAALMPAAPWSAWGAPVFDAQLVRNRHGPVGRWIMEWKCDECLFSEPAAYPQPVAAAPAHRPHQTLARAGQRRAG